MSFTEAVIGDLITPILKWNPKKDSERDYFDYVDLSSIDQETKTIQLNGKVAVEDAPSRARQILEPGDVLVSTVRPNLNGVAIVPSDLERSIGSTGFCVLRTNPKKLCNRYLFHWVKTQSFIVDMTKQATGQSYPAVSDKIVKSSQIPVPKDIGEQKRIAGILDQSDELIRSRIQAIARLKDLSQSIFHEMFGDPVHNERKWDVEKLGDLTTKISSGSTPKGGSKNYVDDGIMFLRSQNVWRNRIELDDVVYIDEATHQKMKKSSLKHGDILITKTGRINTENSSLGRAAMFLGEDDSANVNGHVYLVRPKPDVQKEFVLYIMTTPEYREYIRSVCVGGIDKRQINKEHLEEFPIIYPPIEKQKEFLKKLKAIEEQKARFNEQLKLAETLFLSLQQRAFRGEL